MKKLVPVWTMSVATLSMLAAMSAVVLPASESAVDSRRAEPGEISERELRDFAKTYVAIQKIRMAYEDAARQSRDAQEQSRAQHEALIKIDEALQSQGLQYRAFAQILETVNADETVRARTMKLIEDERRGAG